MPILETGSLMRNRSFHVYNVLRAVRLPRRTAERYGLQRHLDTILAAVKSRQPRSWQTYGAN